MPKFKFNRTLPDISEPRAGNNRSDSLKTAVPLKTKIKRVGAVARGFKKISLAMTKSEAKDPIILSGRFTYKSMHDTAQAAGASVSQRPETIKRSPERGAVILQAGSVEPDYINVGATNRSTSPPVAPREFLPQSSFAYVPPSDDEVEGLSEDFLSYLSLKGKAVANEEGSLVSGFDQTAIGATGQGYDSGVVFYDSNYVEFFNLSADDSGPIYDTPFEDSEPIYEEISTDSGVLYQNTLTGDGSLYVNVSNDEESLYVDALDAQEPAHDAILANGDVRTTALSLVLADDSDEEDEFFDALDDLQTTAEDMINHGLPMYDEVSTDQETLYANASFLEGMDEAAKGSMNNDEYLSPDDIKQMNSRIYENVNPKERPLGEEDGAKVDPFADHIYEDIDKYRKN